MRLSFVVPGRPAPLKRARILKNGWSYDPKENKAAKKMIRWYAMDALRRARSSILGGDLSLEVSFYRSDRRRVDLDNLVKLVLDALNKHVWEDDYQVVELLARKVNVDHPRSEKTIVEIDCIS